MKKIMLHYYRTPALTEAEVNRIITMQLRVASEVKVLKTEFCYNVEIIDDLIPDEMLKLAWFLSETFEPEKFSSESFLRPQSPSGLYQHQIVIEVGPRMNFTTAWSSNAVNAFHSCGLKKVTRIERSRRFLIETPEKISEKDRAAFLEVVHDRMTECEYPKLLTSFESGMKPEPVFEVQVIEKGQKALIDMNKKLGLGLDPWDIEYYYRMFTDDIGRNPTNVECFDLSQSNSEHSRHWFFKGKLIVDGNEVPCNLMQIISEPFKKNPQNSIIAFKDNSSAIKGYKIKTVVPRDTSESSPFQLVRQVYIPIFTAETHNFPSGVAPFPGAETGTGGRIRDIHGTGTGGITTAGTAAYCVGNLFIPDYELSWENKSFVYPSNLASALQIEIQASNGASDYGNKFGEPVIQGFTRSFGMRLSNGERYEWIKPIMFTGGIGQMDERHIEKGVPEEGMLVVKIGGPAYRIGIGGGSASSMIQGENVAELDFKAVQRGDAEMEQKVAYLLRACIEMGPGNPIVSIHDQGAGGNCNVVKEIIYPAGARINVRDIPLGDETLSVLEIWGAEYQEDDAILLMQEHLGLFRKMCIREKVPYAVIGRITGDGYIVLYDEKDDTTPVNLDLEKILGDMPQKTFHLDRISMKHDPLNLPDGLTARDALEKVLRLLSVGSKRFLTNKVDRCVTGLIARQQCCGSTQQTVSDVAVVAQSHFPNDDGLFTGSAISIGEQPILTLLNPVAMARMVVGEMLTNLIWAKISAFEDIKCSGNWMWAAKLPGEGAKLYDAAVALSDILIQLGIAIDGGKDSLSMAAQVKDMLNNTETVKAPGTLVMSAYVTCPDVTKVITPDIKEPGSRLFYIDLANGKKRLGSSALAQVFEQLGDECPNMEDPELLRNAFNAIQEMIEKDLILSGHDVSGGGLITTLLEMAFAGNTGIHVDLAGFNDALSEFFAEELGFVIEVPIIEEDNFMKIVKKYSLPWRFIGSVRDDKRIIVTYEKDPGIVELIINEDMQILRNAWEETSYQLERLQANPDCAQEEKNNIFDRSGAQYNLSFNPIVTPDDILWSKERPKVAIIREEGSNSHREMVSAFFWAGFEPWDVTMTDLLAGVVTLRDFEGIVFVGGFSYADVLDSAKGWAGVIKFNGKLWEEFNDFYNRPDTFSLGVCNGCQLMALLGWVPFRGLSGEDQPRFIQNKSGRFESRFSTVRILKSPSIMLQGMEDSVLGIWVAHGEGRVYFPNTDILRPDNADLFPIRYVEDNGEITMKYPFNPNGSAYGIGGICSPDGRHLAMMPHPERTFLKWQWPWMPEDWKEKLEASPWLKMFQNAYNYSMQNSKIKV